MNVINKHGYKHTHRYIRRSAYNPEDKLNWAQRCCRRIQNKNISISLTAWIFKLGDELKIICGAKTMPMLLCSCSHAHARHHILQRNAQIVTPEQFAYKAKGIRDKQYKFHHLNSIWSEISIQTHRIPINWWLYCLPFNRSGQLCGVHRLSFKWAGKMYVFVFEFFLSGLWMSAVTKTDFGFMLVILLSNRMEFNLFLLKRHFSVFERIATHKVCHRKCGELLWHRHTCAIWYSRNATIEYKFSWNNDGTLIMSKSKSQKFRIIIIEINWFIRCDAMHYHIRFGHF